MLLPIYTTNLFILFYSKSVLIKLANAIFLAKVNYDILPYYK